MGVRIVPLPEERTAIEARAGELGVRFPFDGDALRLAMGRCVFHDDGCRLHATFGVDAKPRVCRQFPWVRRGERVGVDPACAHADGWGTAPEGLLGVDGPPRDDLPPGDLEALARALGVDLAGVGATWRALPWAAWADQGTAGPLRRAGVSALAGLGPPDAWPSWPRGADAIRRAWALGLADDPALLLAGAVVIAAGTERAAWQRHFAVWVRTVR